MISEKKLNYRFLIYRFKCDGFILTHYIDKCPELEGVAVDHNGKLVDLDNAYTWETAVYLNGKYYYNQGYLDLSGGYVAFNTLVSAVLNQEQMQEKEHTFDYMKIKSLPVNYRELKELIELSIVK